MHVACTVAEGLSCMPDVYDTGAGISGCLERMMSFGIGCGRYSYVMRTSMSFAALCLTCSAGARRLVLGMKITIRYAQSAKHVSACCVSI